MKVHIAHWLLITFIITGFETILAQKSVIRFKHYTTDEGLSQNMVDCILKDSKGFMWFGTWNGLNRFDGYNFTVYKQNADDANGLSDNFIYALCEDKYGNIWVGTNNGLNVFLYSENKFINPLKNKSHSISSPKINSILCDRNGFIWVGTSNGVDKLQIKNGKGEISSIVHYSKSGKKNGLSDNNIQALFEDQAGNIWIGTGNGLNVLDFKSGTVKYYFNNPNDASSLSDNYIRSVYRDNQGFLWVGTSFGLNKIELKTNKITRYFHQTANSRSVIHNTTMSITEDKKGRLIFGTLGGISIYNRTKDDFDNYYYKLNDEYGLYSDFVNCLLADNEGNVWVGTEKGGINLYNIFQKQFEFFENEPGNNNSLSHNTINSILEDDKYIWIGTAGGGLNKYNKKTGRFTNFRNSADNNNTISNDFITAIFEENKNNLWIGTWGGGLNKLNPTVENVKKLSRVTFASNTNGVNSFDFISSIISDLNGKMWIGTLGGLILFDPATEKYEYFRASDPRLQILQVGCIQFDKDKNLWAGTINGLFKIQKDENGTISNGNCKVESFYNEPGNPKSIRGNYVISACCDKKGRMWFGTYGNGLNLYIPSNKKDGKGYFISFTENEGLSNNVVYSIVEDNNGNLWLSTDNGLSRFNPETKTFKNYYKTDGLQSNQFYWSASYKNNAGKIYFGGMKGVNAFYPDSIHDVSFTPGTIVTDFKIYNHSVDVGKRYNGKTVLEKSITQTNHIKLSYKLNEFSFEFSALQFNQPENIKYMYKLNGFDKQWTYVDASRRFASYTNIRGGEYVFMVKSLNSQNETSQPPYLVKLTIVPPFWETWWFLLILGITLATGAISFYRYRIYALKKQTRKLEALVQKRTVTIEQQKEELMQQAEQLIISNQQLEKRKELIEGQKEQLQLQNEEILKQRDKLVELNKKVQVANQQQLNFFTHISHEFRTPLTLIIAPLEQLLKDVYNDPSIKNKLTLISKNAQRLLHLINQLMEVRKVETGKTELKTSKDNIVKFIEGISSSFISIANQRQIVYEVQSPKNQLEVYFDHEILENILYNLLSNAFKYTPEKGRITLSVTTSSGKQEARGDVSIIDKHVYKNQNIEEYVKIEVCDTGIGIMPDQIKDIFRRFYRIHSSQSPKVTGSGIGLYLTRELVKTHKGLLYINSRPNNGTAIKILLPMGASHLLAHEIIDSGSKENTDLTQQVQLLSNQMDNDKAESATTSNLHEKQSAAKPLILVVDDDHDLCNYVADSLKHSFRVIQAANGREGIEKAIEFSPDVIISDVMMPETDGLELCTRIKSDIETSHIPVILLTARAEAENFIEGLDSGADDYISKPFNIKIIEAKVRSLIENRKRLRTLFAGSLVPVPREITTTRSDEIFLNKAIKLIEENINNFDWGVKEMASQLCISRSLLHKKLTAIVDQSAVDFITSIKMKKSALMMHQNDLNISEVAYSVGFNDPKYFSRCFKKHFGKTPSEYANQSA